MRRLYLQIYVTFLGILLLFGILISIALYLRPPDEQDRRSIDGLSTLLGEILPTPDRPLEELQAEVERLGRLFPFHITVRAADGGLLAAVGDPLPVPPPEQTQSGLIRLRRQQPLIAFVLPDGRWVMTRWRRRNRVVGWSIGLGLLAVAIGVGSYPIVRRLTRRLERLIDPFPEAVNI